MKKVGIIRCQQTEDICPGTTDFKFASAGKGAFAELGDQCEIVGFLSCGGCPGKKAVFRAKMLAERGVDAVAFTTCMSKGSPINFPCPHFDEIIRATEQAGGDKVKILRFTHP